MNKKPLIAAGLIIGVFAVWRSKLKNVEIAARGAWGEARNQGPKGMQAVINVMDNRRKDSRWGNSLAAVATQPKQFSAFNDGDPNKPLLEQVNDNDPIFVKALELAAQAVQGLSLIHI